MTLNRWDPLRDLLNFQERVSRLVAATSHEASCGRRACWCPVVDMLETPDSYVINMELPGVGKDNIHIEVRGRRLTIAGERTEATREPAAYHTVERAHGAFERSFELPADADVEDAEAKYVDGVLTIEFPKSSEDLGRVLTIVNLR
ncbi:MAG: Hsp20/alpha crystallin family protein [Desulfomonile tiedjei]|nr:Hsp20/alpha crystallin family protein [Desulfomonile tiedjei]